ncbi:hypothetical protein NPIL_324141 [Nephila pilipes]|uniref:Uncharacterized protein n=1 Tax=Nephila pilipes TaxID=299642 RepID=A0A8X6QQD6_NEPPI|nr:hypothetical protein NPIL_324141 [Nephila pilipes]
MKSAIQKKTTLSNLRESFVVVRKGLPNTAYNTIKAMSSLGFETLEHTLYSPYLANSDFGHFGAFELIQTLDSLELSRKL